MRTNLRPAKPGLACGLAKSTAIISVLLAASLLIILPKSAWAQSASHTVCLPTVGSCDYTSPEDAVASPAVSAGDTIDVTTDTYNLESTILVDRSLTILANDSVFDATGLRAIDVSGNTTNLSLTNVTVQNGQATPGTGGGALRVSGGAVVTVVNGTFEANKAEFGGAVHNDGSTLYLNESSFSGNRATAGSGGAIYTDGDGTTELFQTTVDGNLASVTGGGLVADGGAAVNVTQSTISNNAALIPSIIVDNINSAVSWIWCGSDPYGQTFTPGANAISGFSFRIRFEAGATTDLVVPGRIRQGGPTGDILASTTATIPAGTPGTISYILTFTLDQPLGVDPAATYAIEIDIPGAIFNLYRSSAPSPVPGRQVYNCSTTLFDLEFDFQVQGGDGGDGGGVYATGQVDPGNRSTIGLSNSTLSGNVGDGGFATDGGVVSTFFSTVTNNSGNGLTATPAELEPVSVPQGLVFFTTSIIAGNVGNDCDGINLNLTSSGFNLIGDDTGCPFFTGGGIDPASDQVGTAGAPIDPLLGPLQFNGGRTNTHAIDETSPAFDAAGTSTDIYCGAAPVDQRGSGRPNGLNCDIGAFELYLVGPLQTLIDAAAPGATINVPDGVYNEAITIGDGKTLLGSSQDNVVIDGSDLGTSAITATGDFTLQGISVANGSTTGSGGGISATTPGTNINLIDALLENNHADVDGGAIYIQAGTLTGSNVTFNNNSATGNGGAIFNSLSIVNLQDVVIETSSATLGGAIFNDAGSQLFIGNQDTCSNAPADINSPVANLISNNTATGVAGAILVNGTVVIGETRFTENSAPSGGVLAGGGGSLAIDCSIFDANDASAGSGGAINTDNFSIDTSLFEDNYASVSGGAFMGASGTIGRSIFRLNLAATLGGAVFTDAPLVSNLNFYESNRANYGGAISTDLESSGPVSSIDDTFISNSALVDGGAVLARDVDIDIDHGLFQGNTAGDTASGIAGRGGAVHSNQLLNVFESNFTGNSVDDGLIEGVYEPGQGGAIFNAGQLNLSDSTIDNSSAGTGGGLYNNWVANTLITGTTFHANDASGSGTVGGAIGGGGAIDLRNSTLSGNTTSGGGNGAGIGLVSGEADLRNVTLAYNASSGLGGPFYANSGEPGARIRFSNSLLSDNTDSGIDCGTLESLGFNLFQAAPCPTDPSDIVGATLIAFLASNGGPTQTHALLGASPAVNAGHPVPRFPQFDGGNISLLQTQGATRVESGTLLLADETSWVGSAFVKNPIDPALDFSAQFEFQITPSLNTGEASDGITFSIADDPTVLGGRGGLLGIAIYDPQGTPGDPGSIGVMNGVSVEFDTWVNGTAESANDPGSNDHIGININGSLFSLNPVIIGPHGTLSDGSIWTAWIDYNAASNFLEVRASNDGIRPVAATVSATVDIAALTGPNAYVGFTGASAGGSIAGRHRIVSFAFDNSCETTDQRGNARPNGAACDIGAFEGVTIPLQLESVSMRAVMRGPELGDGSSYPGVVDIPIIDIPIEKLTGDTFNAPESAPLGSFPLGSFPIGSFDLQSSPLGSFPLGSFPLGSFPLGSFPLGSFPLSSIPLLSIGGWSEILDGITELAGTPQQGVTLEQLMTLDPVPEVVKNIELRDLSILDSPLASLSLPGISLGGTTVQQLNEWGQNANPTGAETVCAQLAAADASFTDCQGEDTLLSLEAKGAPVSALSLSSLPLGSFPLGSFPLGSFPIGSFPLGSFPLGSFPLGSFPLGSFPLGSFPLGSFPLGSFPMGSFDLLAAPTDSLPLGSFPIGSFPLGSFEIDGQSFCEFYDNEALGSGDKTCAELNINPTTDSLTDLVFALQNEAIDNGDTTGGIASTPLGSFPMGSFPIGSFPIGSFPLGSFDLEAAPLSEITLGHFGGCQAIDGTDDCSNTAAFTADSSLLDVETEYGTLAASPLGSFPLGSFGIADLPMGSFPLGSFEINGTPLGSFPLGSFDLVSSPLGSFPLGSFASIITGPCPNCETLADAAKAGAISSSATLASLAGSAEFDNTTLGVVLDAMTLAMIHGPGELKDIEDPGNLTLGQMLIAMMLKTDFPWETIPLEQLNPQEFSADHFVDFEVDFTLTGTEQEEVWVRVTMAESFLFEDGSATLDVTTTIGPEPQVSLPDPEIFLIDGMQILTFKMNLGGYSDNTVSFTAIPPLALGDYPTAADIVFVSDIIRSPAAANNSIQAVSGLTGSRKSRISASSEEASVIAAAEVVGTDKGMLTVISDPKTNSSQSDEAITAPTDELILGFIDSPSDNDYYKVAPPRAGDRVAVFMSNPAGDNDLIMYEPLSTVEAKGQLDEAPPLDSIPFEDDGVNYRSNLSEEPNALEDVNLADSPLASISTNRGTIDESVSAIAGNDEPFIIQVSGYNGARSEQPYTLRVKVTPQAQAPQCSARTWPGTVSPTVVPVGAWTANTNAVFLVNGSRLASSEPGTPLAAQAAADDALTAINNLTSAPGIVDGVVVDVSDIFGVDYTDWDANPCAVDAANNIVNAITQYLDEQRRLYSPNLAYVTIVGSDEVIPFARKPDETSIANESTFAGEFADNAMYGALVTRHFLSDDTYGDIDPVAWLDRYLNVPELGVGRLVEAAADIQAAAENYIASAGILDPQTALSAGYDFISDASAEIDQAFRENSPLLGYSVEPALIDPAGITPKTDAWTRTDFLNATAVNTADPVDLVSFNMHFDFDEALPSIGDATKNPSAELIHVSDLAGADLTGGIWFTVGCHSGSSVADVSVVGAPSEDWAQTFSRGGALFLAQNAYGLGDTEAVALTERLMVNFARNLNGRLTVGQAHAFAKQQYFADLGLYGEYDFKALQAATLFGLPMYQYGLAMPPAEPPTPPLPVAADPLSGLSSASWSLPSTGIQQSSTGKGELFSVDGEVQFVHFRPLQPIVRRDVTGPNGEVAGGAFLTSLVTEDKTVTDMAFARPVIDLGENETEIESDEVVFPTAFTNIATFNAPPPEGGPFAPRQQLNVIVGQFTSPADGGSSGTERLFRSFDAQVFYREPPAAGSGLSAFASAGGGAGIPAEDFLRPELDNVQATIVGPAGARQAAFSVDANDEGTVVRVAVLYLQSVSETPEVSGNPERGYWVLVDLVRNPGTNTWTGGGPVDLSGIADGQIDYMVQALDANGNVANSTFKGLFYTAEELPPPPEPDPESGSIGVVVKVGDVEVDPGSWITTDPVDIKITDQNPAITYEYSVDFAPFTPLTSSGFQVNEDGVHTVTVRETGGSNPVTFVVLIDTTPPQVEITTPSEGGFIVKGQAPAADFDCLDAGSGIESCVGTVPDGTTVPAVSTGSHTFTVAAQDDAQLGPTVAENTYFVVKPFEVSGPTEPGAIADPVMVTASATDLAEFGETASIDWGDGSPVEVIDLGGGSVNSITGSHVYPVPGIYQITVSVDYDGQFTQAGTVDFVTIYDPEGSSVSGRGKFQSPAGAYTPDDDSDEDVTGRAEFNFNLEYRYQAPRKGKGKNKGPVTPGYWVLDGRTKFHFPAAGIKFETEMHDWMVIDGAHAIYQGETMIEDSEELHKFQVIAVDADVSGAEVSFDSFRIRIWREDSSGAKIVLYDNEPGSNKSAGNSGVTPMAEGFIKIKEARNRK